MRKKIFREYYYLESELIMIYTGQTNKNQKHESSLIERFIIQGKGQIAAYLPPGYRIAYIQSPLNYRLSTAMLRPCCRLVKVTGTSSKKNYNRGRSHLRILPRNIESNEFDNLSPPCFVKNNIKT